MKALLLLLLPALLVGCMMEMDGGDVEGAEHTLGTQRTYTHLNSNGCASTRMRGRVNALRVALMGSHSTTRASGCDAWVCEGGSYCRQNPENEPWTSGLVGMFAQNERQIALGMYESDLFGQWAAEGTGVHLGTLRWHRDSNNIIVFPYPAGSAPNWGGTFDPASLTRP